MIQTCACMPALDQLGIKGWLHHGVASFTHRVTDDVYKMISMNLRNLPTDVLLGILQRLEVNDVLALRRVSAPSDSRCLLRS